MSALEFNSYVAMAVGALKISGFVFAIFDQHADEANGGAASKDRIDKN